MPIRPLALLAWSALCAACAAPGGPVRRVAVPDPSADDDARTRNMAGDGSIIDRGGAPDLVYCSRHCSFALRPGEGVSGCRLVSVRFPVPEWPRARHDNALVCVLR